MFQTLGKNEKKNKNTNKGTKTYFRYFPYIEMKIKVFMFIIHLCLSL